MTGFPSSPSDAERRTPLAAEALGYAGGVLAIAAGIFMVRELVPGFPAGAWLVALGAVGVLLVVPQTATRYLPTSAAVPVAIFVTGVVMLGSAVWLARRRAGSA